MTRHMLIIYYWQESSVWLWRQTVSHPLMIPLHCLWAKSNNRTRHKFEYDVTLLIFLLFLFDFVDSHARCSCCFIVCLRFQVMRMKQKWAKCFLKSVILRKHFVIFLENGTHKNVKPRKSNSEALAQPWPQRTFSLQQEGKKQVFNFLKLLWGREWLQVNEKKEVNLEIEKERGGWEGVRLKLDVQGQGSGRI